MSKNYIHSSVLIILSLLQVASFNVFGTTIENSDSVPVLNGYNRYDSLWKDTIAQYDMQMHHPTSYLIRRPVFISVKYSGGKAMVDSEKLKTCYSQYGEIKVGFSSLGNRWKDIVYGMPYYGIGAGFYDYGSSQTGNPVSVYLFQGGTLKALNRKSTLKYEWNFGTSFNWKRYHRITNPDNKCIGAPINVYFAANLIYTYRYSKEIDINTGLTLNHVSNGATRMPNSGVNTLAGFVGLSYHFDRDRIMDVFNPSLHAPVYEEGRLISDFSFHTTVRQRRLPMKETGLSTKYINHSFFVAGASYALLHMPDYEYRYGGGIDIVYDESAGFSAKKIGEKPNGRDIAEVSYGDFKGRFGLGFSARGEVVMPKYSVTGQLGYEVIKGKKDDGRLYQIFNLKVPLWNNIYGSFMLRSQSFSKAQYMFWGIGYRIDHRPFKIK